MRWRIMFAVGVGQPNHHDDVKKIQMLLNRTSRDDGHDELLKEDGIFGPKTQNRIAYFQREIIRLPHVDSIVNVKGPTFNSLNHSSNVRTTQPYNKNHAVVEPKDHMTGFLITKARQNLKPYKLYWFNRALPAAINVKSRWGVPIAVTLSQGAFESNWGRTAPSNMYFGIKGLSPSGKTVKVTTHENYHGNSTTIKDGFRAYSNLEEAADDYGRFLATNRRYRSAFAFRDDPEKFIHMVATAGYATNPSYEKLIVSIIRANGLSDYDSPNVATSARFENPLHQ